MGPAGKEIFSLRKGATNMDAWTWGKRKRQVLKEGEVLARRGTIYYYKRRGEKKRFVLFGKRGEAKKKGKKKSYGGVTFAGVSKGNFPERGGRKKQQQRGGESLKFLDQRKGKTGTTPGGKGGGSKGRGRRGKKTDKRLGGGNHTFLLIVKKKREQEFRGPSKRGGGTQSGKGGEKEKKMVRRSQRKKLFQVHRKEGMCTIVLVRREPVRLKGKRKEKKT